MSRKLLHFADLLQPAAEKNHAHRFEHERYQKYNQNFGHVTNPGNESASRCAPE